MQGARACLSLLAARALNALGELRPACTLALQPRTLAITTLHLFGAQL